MKVTEGRFDAMHLFLLRAMMNQATMVVTAENGRDSSVWIVCPSDIGLYILLLQFQAPDLLPTVLEAIKNLFAGQVYWHLVCSRPYVGSL